MILQWKICYILHVGSILSVNFSLVLTSHMSQLASQRLYHIPLNLEPNSAARWLMHAITKNNIYGILAFFHIFPEILTPFKYWSPKIKTIRYTELTMNSPLTVTSQACSQLDFFK